MEGGGFRLYISQGRKALNVCLSLSLSLRIGCYSVYISRFTYARDGNVWMGWLVGWLWMEGLEQSRDWDWDYVDGGVGRCGSIKAIR